MDHGTQSFVFADQCARLYMEQLQVESLGRLHDTESTVLYKGNRFCYPLQAHISAVDAFQ